MLEGGGPLSDIAKMAVDGRNLFCGCAESSCDSQTLSQEMTQSILQNFLVNIGEFESAQRIGKAMLYVVALIIVTVFKLEQ